MKNKKVFGKINIIDFIVLLAIILAIAVIGVSKLSGFQGSTEKNLEITYFAREIPSSMAERIKKGDKLYDDTGKANLGEVTDTVVGDSVSYAQTQDGVVKSSHKDGYNSVKITSRVKGEKNDFGVKIDKQQYGIGHTFTIVSDNTKFEVRVYDIKVKD